MARRTKGKDAKQSTPQRDRAMLQTWLRTRSATQTAAEHKVTRSTVYRAMARGNWESVASEADTTTMQRLVDKYADDTVAALDLLGALENKIYAQLLGPTPLEATPHHAVRVTRLKQEILGKLPTVPPSNDATVLNYVLSIADTDEARRVLDNCRTAIGGGVVIPCDRLDGKV